LGLSDSTTLRLSAHNCYSHAPKLPSLAYRAVDTLTDMLDRFNSTSDILYYEVLDMPLPELERLKTLKIMFHGRDTKHVETFNVRMPNESCVADVLADLKGRLGEKLTPGADLRLLELFYSKIYKVFPDTEKIEGIDDQYWTLRAEEVKPEEDGDLPGQGKHSTTNAVVVGSPPEEGDGMGGGVGGGGEWSRSEKLIHVYHFYREGATTNANRTSRQSGGADNNNDNNDRNQAVQNFGDPFLLRVGADEPLSAVKRRIQGKLGTPDEEFSTWKWAYHSLGRPDYLEEDDVVASRFVRRDTYGAYENYLGMEHPDKHPRKARG